MVATITGRVRSSPQNECAIRRSLTRAMENRNYSFLPFYTPVIVYFVQCFLQPRVRVGNASVSPSREYNSSVIDRNRLISSNTILPSIHFRCQGVLRF